MELVKITCEIRYLERIKLLEGYEAIRQDMLKKKPEKAEPWFTPGIRIEDKGKKSIMVVDSMRSAIDIEQPPDVGFCRDFIIRFFSSVDARLGIPQVGRYGLRSTWIQDYKGSFQELRDKCKQRILGNSTLIEKADDLGIVLDYQIDSGQKVSITMGPMELEQLKRQFLTFEPESFPPLFLYVDVDVGNTTTKQFSKQYLRNFFDKAVKEGEKLSSEVSTQVGVNQ